MASKLGKALGGLGGSLDMGSGDEDMGSEEEAPMSDAKPDTGSAELMAMKMFEKATSPEAKVSALKAFLEACGAIGSDY